MSDADRAAMLKAIARSRGWIERIESGSTLQEIAAAENLVERHVRFLAPLAYLSPRIVSAIAEGCVPAHVTISELARALPLSWAKQEVQLGIA